MAKLIEARTRVEAWMGGVEHLLNGEPTLNLVLVIESPGSNGRYPAADRGRPGIREGPPSADPVRSAERLPAVRREEDRPCIQS